MVTFRLATLSLVCNLYKSALDIVLISLFVSVAARSNSTPFTRPMDGMIIHSVYIILGGEWHCESRDLTHFNEPSLQARIWTTRSKVPPTCLANNYTLVSLSGQGLHLSQTDTKASSRLHILRVCKFYGLPLDHLHILFTSLILPTLTYAVEVWGCAYYQKYLSRIDRLFKTILSRLSELSVLRELL